MAEVTQEFKSVISARPAFNRNISLSMTNLSAAPVASGRSVFRMVREVSSGTTGNGPQSGIGAGSVAAQLRDEREKEKMEMQHLNDKLANFIEKVRFLDAQNRILLTEKEKLEKCSEKGRNSHALYEAEITGGQQILADMKKENSGKDGEMETLVKEVEELKQKLDAAISGREEDAETIDKLLVEYSDMEAEINLLKRRIALREEDLVLLKKDNSDVTVQLSNTRLRIDQENLMGIHDKNQVEVLKEELKFTNEAYDQELRDLLAQAARDTTSENRDYFRSELSNAMREIRDDHNALNNAHRQEMESMYMMQIQEFETQSAKQNIEHTHHQDEIKRRKVQLNDMRQKLTDLQGRNALLETQITQLNHQMEDDARMNEAELNEKDRKIRNERESNEAIMLEYQMMLEKSQTLTNEIKVLRDMLEGEGGSGLKQIVENYVKTNTMNEVIDTETMRIMKGESTSRSTNSRSAKGNVAIKEVCPSAAFIVLENTHRSKDEKVGGWKLKRKIDGKCEVVYTFPEEYVIKGGQSVKIATKGASLDENENILMFDAASFGSGASMSTTLYNGDGEERASLVQRQVDSERKEEVAV